LNKGYTSNGKDSSVTIFDLKTLKIIKNVKVTGANPDCIIYDQFSKRVFTFNGKSNNATALNAETGAVEGTIALGGKPEFSISNGFGNVYVNLEDKNEMDFINPKTLAIGYQIKLDSVEEPSAMSYDVTTRHLYIGGGNKMMIVLNGDNGGKNVCRHIGEGVDAMAFNDNNRILFAACGEGNLYMIKQKDRDHYVKMDSIPTQKGARTLAIDMKTDRIFLPVADFGPPAPAEPGKKQRPSIVPGTFGILVVGRQ
jgi:DNA-binding beta-propeller fold protein YncE